MSDNSAKSWHGRRFPKHSTNGRGPRESTTGRSPYVIGVDENTGRTSSIRGHLERTVKNGSGQSLTPPNSTDWKSLRAIPPQKIGALSTATLNGGCLAADLENEANPPLLVNLGTLTIAEIAFTIEGATDGDRFELSTDTGIIEHDLGGYVLDLERVTNTDLPDRRCLGFPSRDWRYFPVEYARRTNRRSGRLWQILDNPGKSPLVHNPMKPSPYTPVMPAKYDSHH